MANPALIKAAVVLLTDKRTWKAIGVVVAAILTPFILLVVIICSMLSGTANHNNAAVELTFYGGSLPIHHARRVQGLHHRNAGLFLLSGWRHRHSGGDDGRR